MGSTILFTIRSINDPLFNATEEALEVGWNGFDFGWRPQTAYTVGSLLTLSSIGCLVAFVFFAIEYSKLEKKRMKERRK